MATASRLPNPAKKKKKGDGLTTYSGSQQNCSLAGHGCPGKQSWNPPHRPCTTFATTPTTDSTGRLYAMKEAQRETTSKKFKEKENTTFMIGNVVSKIGL